MKKWKIWRSYTRMDRVDTEKWLSSNTPTIKDGFVWFTDEHGVRHIINGTLITIKEIEVES